MKRRYVENALSWLFCVALLGALFFSLDDYRRIPRPKAYGPDLRLLFSSTLARARELRDDGAVRVSPDERWHLVGEWDTPDETGTARPHAAQRRAILILPLLVPEDVELEMELVPLGEAGRAPDAVEVDFGVNGQVLGSSTIPSAGAVFRGLLPRALLFRGDNLVFFYRTSPRSDPSPWLAIGEVRFRRRS